MEASWITTVVIVGRVGRVGELRLSGCSAVIHTPPLTNPINAASRYCTDHVSGHDASTPANSSGHRGAVHQVAARHGTPADQTLGHSNTHVANRDFVGVAIN
jgi:hypothetical protein